MRDGAYDQLAGLLLSGSGGIGAELALPGCECLSGFVLS
jgi:hypothetical protein